MKNTKIENIIFTKCPTILTSDNEWVEKMQTRHRIDSGEVILLPPDAIIVADRDDVELTKRYNNPLRRLIVD